MILGLSLFIILVDRTSNVDLNKYILITTKNNWNKVVISGKHNTLEGAVTLALQLFKKTYETDYKMMDAAVIHLSKDEKQVIALPVKNPMIN